MVELEGYEQSGTWLDTLVWGHGLHISPTFVSTEGVFDRQSTFVRAPEIERAKVPNRRVSECRRYD